ncbi:MAG: flagellar hook protein FlgE [Terriglobales bacterium]
MPSFSVPLSGLNASSQELTVISNNLANLNTPGFKSSSTEFTTLFYQMLGDAGNGNPMQVGTGSQVGSMSMDMTDGAVQSTGIPSNMAIQGGGMFVVNKNGQQMYTRAGDFTVNSGGLLTAPDGSLVQGYQAVNGVMNPNSPIGDLNLSDTLTNPPRSTANVTMSLNLDSQTAVGGTFSQPLQVYDSLGGTHTLSATFTKTGTNAWSYVVTLPGADTGSATPTTMASGNMTFDSSGNLIPTNGSNPPNQTITLSSGALTDGGAALNMGWQLFTPQGSSMLTQVAGASAPLGTTQDGIASGNLVSFNIESDGVVTGSFNNGQTATLGQVVLANFANMQGLEATGGNNFVSTAASGLPTIGVPGSGSLGAVQGGSIEQSNVDIAAQFANLIEAQQSYEASAKTVTTFDQVTQDTLNMQQ